jgi:methionine sulfoxide reductase heme-binding subunit
VRRAALVSRVIRPALFAAGLVPFAWLVQAAFTGGLGAEPVEKIQQVTGLSTLSILMLTLGVTPLRRLTGWNEAIKLRRMIGLFAFFYAALHATTYFVFDQSLSLELIAEDVAKHPWVTVGFATLLMLIPLAVTSTNGWIRRLGGRRWKLLHRLVYPAALGGVLHYLWLVKKDVTGPLLFASVLGVLFAARMAIARGRRPAPAAARPVGVPGVRLPAEERTR